MTAERHSSPKAIDLFSGAGGLAEGLESAGIAVVAAVELHPQPALTHAFNHANTAVFAGNIVDLSMDLLECRIVEKTSMPVIDLVVGGPPCQGFSTAGKKRFSDPRNSLFRHFTRVVEHFQPRMFLLENVPGFAHMHGGMALLDASKLFTALGYEIDHRVVNATCYGVPQRRKRFIMVGWLPDQVNGFTWPKETNDEVNNGLSLPGFDDLESPVTVEQAIGDLAFLKPGWESHRHHRKPFSDYQLERRNGCDYVFNHLATKHREKAEKMFSYIPEGGTIAAVPLEFRSSKRTMAHWNHNKVSNAVLALPDDLIHYAHDRIPTVRELVRLQTFDDSYVIIGKRTSGFVERRVDVPQYTQVGNAVPPLLGKALGGALVKSLEASERDLRDLEERQRRHSWVQGSSGYSGYTLNSAAYEEIRLENIKGDKLDLPVCCDEVPVVEAEPLIEWKKMPRNKRRQWAPGVRQRAVPAHQCE